MSTVYGSPGYGGLSGPPRRVSYGWIGESWNLFSANAGIWILAVVVLTILPGIVSYGITFAFGASGHTVPATPTPGSSPFSSILSGGGLPLGVSLGIDVFSIVWTSFFYGGLYRMAVKQVRGEPISAGDIFSGGPLFLKMLGFSIVSGFATGIGVVLCILPGLLIAGLLLPGYALIADGESLGTAISRSTDAMKADMWNAAGFVFILGLLIALSALPCGLGVFVTYPMLWIVSALAYRDMIGMPNMIAPSGPVYGAQQAGVWPPPPQPGAPPPSGTIYGQNNPPQSGTIYGQNPNPPPAFGQGPTTPAAFGQTQSPPPAPQQTPPPATPFATPSDPTPPANPFAQQTSAPPPSNPFAPSSNTPPPANPFANPAEPPPARPPRTSLSGEPLDEDKTNEAG